jgi:hypothetical protein
MEVLAITQIFERRVIRQYKCHRRAPGLRGAIRETLTRILHDERWHIEWVRSALRGMEPAYGRDHVRATLARYAAADREIYQTTIGEHAERVRDLERSGRFSPW